MKKLIVGLLSAVMAVAAVAAPVDRAARIRAKLLSDDRSYVFVAVHRGDWRHHPENSVSAIEGAIAMGADIVEIDVRRTKDGQFVLSHDPDIKRMTGKEGKVAELTFAEIREATLRMNQGGKKAEMTSEKIPTLEEALKAAKGRILVNIDKFDTAPSDIMRVIDRLGMTEEVIIKSGGSYDATKKRIGEPWELVEEGKMLFMPIVSIHSKAGQQKLQAWLVSPCQPKMVECCFSEVPEEFFKETMALAPPAPRWWVNTLWDSLCAGHTDARSVGGDPDGGWGWVLERNATMIQSDRPAELIKYLESKGRRNL